MPDTHDVDALVGYSTDELLALVLDGVRCNAPFVVMEAAARRLADLARKNTPPNEDVDALVRFVRSALDCDDPCEDCGLRDRCPEAALTRLADLARKPALTDDTIEALVRVAEAAEWALDLLDMYDEQLISLGEPREVVYSDIQVAGKRKARAALSRLRPTTEEGEDDRA